ncbi:MAG TPA: DUF2779 domain-containing protein [Acholeplasma sp.]|nr:DUF2779 domain-containing protein [Acholeplasma sp.]
MKISKTQFLNIMKFDYLKWLKSIQEDEVIIEFNKDLKIEELIKLENNQKSKAFMESLYNDDEEELNNKIDLKLEMLMPYYQELEMISGRAIKDKFGGDVIYSLETYNQKRFNYKNHEFDFYCFLDGYQEDEDTIRIFETKATTSSKFSLKGNNFFFTTLDDKVKHEFFIKDKEDIYFPYEDIKKLKNSDYFKNEKKLFNKFDDRGHYIYDLLYQKYVIENAVKTKKKIEYYLVILDHEYIHDGKSDYPNEIVRFYNLSSLLNKMMNVIKDDINETINIINKYNNKDNINLKESDLASYYYSDIDLTNFPSKNNLLIYTNRHHGFKDEKDNKYSVIDLLKAGYRHAIDVPYELLHRENNKIQRRVIEENKPYFNREKIRQGIKLLKYPIYHLDFESFNAPLPRFKGESPYSQSLFQYSVHIERKPGICHKDNDNYYYLAKDHKDNRLSLLESMLDVIKPDGGSVLVYNVRFEKARLKELQQYYPKYYNELEDIINRLFDLQHLIKGNKSLYLSLGFDKDDASLYNYYHQDLEGSYSIKKVLPLFSKLSYDTLDVKDGIEAMITYHSFPLLDEKAFNKEYQALIEYCKQDTWAMFEILNKLREI